MVISGRVLSAARVELILLELHRLSQRARGFHGLLARRFGFAKECCIHLAQRSTKTEALRFNSLFTTSTSYSLC